MVDPAQPLPSVLDGFSPATAGWFRATFAAPTAAQDLGWRAIAKGDHTLIHAPTGSGKTLAAFLHAIDTLSTAPLPDPRSRCRVLYVSPLKALAYDVDRNLRAPLTGILSEAQRHGHDVHPISVSMRTGDTPQRERQAMRRTPPDLLITTPESLYLMLTSRAREVLASVETVIIDEVHAIAGTKRGSHLALSLERLDDLCEAPVQRIGLSATQRPLEVTAEFLGGGTRAGIGGESADGEGEQAAGGRSWTPRAVTIVDAPSDKHLDVEIVVPVGDMTRPELDAPDQDMQHRSIWPAMYPRLLELVQEHRSTILFVNSRGLAERLAAELNRLADEELVKAHHGSVSREQRIEIEDRLKRGDLRGVVATSTLELGIDMAAVDLVVLVESPSSVARGLQRIGRAGHQVGAPSVGKVFPKHRGDLLETAVVVERMYEGDIEHTRIPQNPIDVLAQHLVAIVAMDDTDVDDCFELVTRAAPFSTLTRSTFEGVLDMLSGRYPSDDFAELRPRIVWDRSTGQLSARSNARLLAVTNPGTIPDRGLYTVHLPEGGRVGELDEEMVYESRPGDTFVLGSTSWRIDEITHDRVTVTPAPESGVAKMPFWHGDAPGRPIELGRAVGAFTREIAGLETEQAEEVLRSRYRLDERAARNLAAFIADEREASGVVPSDRTIVVQRFRDEIGDWRIVVLSPFGGRVHAPWALAIRNRYREDNDGTVDVVWSDDGIILRFPDVDTPPDTGMVYLDPAEIEERVIEETADTALFASRFRESAARALLLPRRRPGTRTPLWLQRRKAANLLEATRGFGSFPIVLEAYREVLQDHFDVPALAGLLTDISKRTTRIAEVDTDGPTPFATSLMFDFVANFMYEYDAPLAERRAAALTLDRSLLAELLGEPEFRELLDADVVDAVELDLQHLSEERRIRSLDGLHDALRDLGPLSEEGVRARMLDSAKATAWLTELERSGRVYERSIDGFPVFVAAEDMSRLRDAIGVHPPPGIPTEFLEPVADPLGDIIGRYARTHGPFTVVDAASSTHIAPAMVTEVLTRLADAGKVSLGAYRPGGTEQEWISVDVLQRLRRRSLAALRNQVEAVEAERYAALLPVWQGASGSRSVPVEDLIKHLAGAPIAARELDAILTRRNPNGPAEIDQAMSLGEVVWVGTEAVGQRDGRIMLLPRTTAGAFIRTPNEVPELGVLAKSVLEHLRANGASFFPDIYQAVGGGSPEDLADAIWDLVWAGEVTNDSLEPLRAFTRARRRQSTRRPVRVAVPPHAKGRWYLTASLIDDDAPGESNALTRATALLERHGIVTRDAVLAEGVPGGFSGLYPAFSSLEDVGAARRGYFVEGMGGAQFALPGAVDRLRMDPDESLVILSVGDPAQPYGAAIPWPESPARPDRRAGATVALSSGRLLAWMSPNAKRVSTFTRAHEEDAPVDDDVVAAICALADERSTATIERIDGIDARDHLIGPSLVAAGFTSGYKGLTVRPARMSTSRQARDR